MSGRLSTVQIVRVFVVVVWVVCTRVRAGTPIVVPVVVPAVKVHAIHLIVQIIDIVIRQFLRVPVWWVSSTEKLESLPYVDQFPSLRLQV
jgi:hypothetical protein